MNQDCGLTETVLQVICSLCSKEQDVSCLPKSTTTNSVSGTFIFGCTNCMKTVHFHRQVQQNCSNCGACMGKYFCEICKFFDDDVSVLKSQMMNKNLNFIRQLLNLHKYPVLPNLTNILICSRSQRANTIVMDVAYAGNYHTNSYVLDLPLRSLKFC